jgi:hypothetical protein
MLVVSSTPTVPGVCAGVTQRIEWLDSYSATTFVTLKRHWSVRSSEALSEKCAPRRIMFVPPSRGPRSGVSASSSTSDSYSKLEE